jgi:DNA-directed RNA polymerase subunit RPC12/RpoP
VVQGDRIAHEEAPVIEFLCPNGHRIRCPAEQAGRAAKCPRCGVKFRVPESADLAPSDVLGSDSAISPAEFTDSSISDKKAPSAIGRAEREPPIEFLCPNGHRLFGAASLQGKGGKCPECGSRFRIPMREDAMPADAPNSPSATASLAPVVVSPTHAASAALLERLWNALPPEGGVVEVHLRDGTKLSPERFLRKLSGPAYAVFVSREADSSMTVAAVPWDAITRVLIGGLKELPPSL